MRDRICPIVRHEVRHVLSLSQSQPIRLAGGLISKRSSDLADLVQTCATVLISADVLQVRRIYPDLT